MANPLTDTKVSTRISFLVFIALIGMGVMLLVSATNISELLWKEAASKTGSHIDIAATLAKEYQDRVKSGELTLEEGKKRALQRLGSVRYDGDNYYWVNDLNGIMLMHPTSPKLVGTDVRDLKDADGKKIFADMIDVVKEKNQGEYRYQWPPDETAKPKMSYVKGIPDWGWVIGTGIYADHIQKSVTSEVTKLGGIALIVIITAMIIAIMVGHSIASPIKYINTVMKRLADGDLSVNIDIGERKDEIGAMIKTVRVFQENARQVEQLKAQQAETEKRAAEEKRKTMNQLADGFEKSVGHIVNVVASASTELQASSKNLSEMAEQTSSQTATVAAATEEASASVQTVASAAEELSASISEINRQIAESTRVAAHAVEEVKKTDTTVSTLSEAAAQIGDVVKLIQDIAEQTNLLALNATIEAARAGEAGKGFAVVASEVKNLANQTGRATEEISKKIITVQSVSNDSVAAIRSIGHIIEQIDQITKTIATALGQQDMATREISNNVQQASSGTNEISNSIVNVTHAAKESRSAAEEVLGAANELSRQSESLRGEISKFLETVRSS
ncbi:MAG: cache domain-containing protein [Alphaproteobacteria bacterium]|jgi:methyl-accepting chemotaxis protein|nr:cache domain-containing protein [Alphaproteobacteria bacterium]